MGKCLQVDSKREVYIGNLISNRIIKFKQLITYDEIYKDQLEVLLNSSMTFKFLFETCNQGEKTSINTLILETLIGSSGPKTSKSNKSIPNLFNITNDLHIIRLIRALRLFFYLSDKSKRDQFTILSENLEHQGSTNR